MQLLFEYLPGMDLAEVGGTLSRASEARYVDKNGVVRLAAAGVLRDAHYINGVRHTLVEKTSTNLCLRSEDFGTTWSPSGTPTRTAAAHTAAGVTLDLIGDDSSGSTVEGYTQLITFTGDGVKALSVHVKEDTSAGSFFGLLDATAGVRRLFGLITFVDGLPTVDTAGIGSYLGYEALADGVFRLLFSTSAVTAANTNLIEVYPATNGALSGAPTGTVYMGGVQGENSHFPTSYIKTEGSTVGRNADELYFTYAHVPQELTAYAKFTERGTIIDSGRVFQLGTGNPKFALLGNSSGYRAHHNNGLDASDAIATVPAFGDTVEVRTMLDDDTGVVSIGQSTNGGVEATTVGNDPAGSVAAAWSSARVYIGGDGAAVADAVALRVLRIVAETRSMAEMRAPFSYIRFEDSEGVAYLSNEKPYPANRFANWTPESVPFGDSTPALADGAIAMLRLRTDRSASFELPHIPSQDVDGEVPLEIADRLKEHLLAGGTCLVVTGDAAGSNYSPCGLKPGTTPQLQLTDRRTMEYTLTLALLNLADSPARMICRYAEQ